MPWFLWLTEAGWGQRVTLGLSAAPHLQRTLEISKCQPWYWGTRGNFPGTFKVRKQNGVETDIFVRCGVGIPGTLHHVGAALKTLSMCET